MSEQNIIFTLATESRLQRLNASRDYYMDP